MSVFFNALIIDGGPSDRKAIIELEDLMKSADPEREQTFNKIDMDSAGGSKWFTNDVYAGCFNHFIPDDIEKCIEKTKWEYPDSVIFVRNSGDYYYEGEPNMIYMSVSDMRKKQQTLDKLFPHAS